MSASSFSGILWSARPPSGTRSSFFYLFFAVRARCSRRPGARSRLSSPLGPVGISLFCPPSKGQRACFRVAIREHKTPQLTPPARRPLRTRPKKNFAVSRCSSLCDAPEVFFLFRFPLERRRDERKEVKKKAKKEREMHRSVFAVSKRGLRKEFLTTLSCAR